MSFPRRGLLRRCALAGGFAFSLGSCTNGTQQRAPSPTATPAATPAATTLGRYLASHGSLFPANRVVAYYGEAGVPAMGVLGEGALTNVTPRLKKQAAAYARFGRPVIPAFELIAISAQSAPGASASYHGAADDATIRRYLAGARAMSGFLVLDIQPGRSRFLPLVKSLAAVLREPDVGIALDPEWEMGPSEIPGRTIGGTTGAEVNEVARYVAGIVRANHLPQKLFVVHEFTPEMIEGRSQIVPLPELATTFHVDGFGARPNKLNIYHSLATSDGRFHNGMKLFYTQDVHMFEPSDIVHQSPQPDLITYQ